MAIINSMAMANPSLEMENPSLEMENLLTKL
jgi:hypothetical protein